MSDVDCNWYKEAFQNDTSKEHRVDVDGGLNIIEFPTASVLQKNLVVVEVGTLKLGAAIAIIH